MPTEQEALPAPSGEAARIGETARLLALALTGSLVWHALLLAPWALSLGIGAIWYHSPWTYGMAALMLLFIAWMLSPDHRLEGRSLQRDEAPALFAEIDRLRAVAGAPAIHEVLLDDALNAGATTLGRSWWPGGARRVLVLGLPLLAALPAAEVSAVIAHELGHFSRRHGALGQWLYRTRLLWLWSMGQLERDSSVLDQLGVRFANWFAPRFGRLAMQHSRRCEYEADAIAVRACPNPALIQALLRLDVLVQREQAWQARQLPAWQQATALAPASGWLRRWGELSAKAAGGAEVASAWQRRPAPDDSHPVIQQRAQAAGAAQAPAGLPGLDPGHCAGAAWLGERWPVLVAEADAAWQHGVARDWQADHLHLAAQRQCLAALEGSPASLRQVQLLRATGQIERADALLAQLSASPTAAAEPGLRFAWAMARLEAPGDPSNNAEAASEALTLALESVVQADPSFALPVRRALVAHALAQGDSASADRHELLAQRALRRRDQAWGAAMTVLERGELQAPTWPAPALQAFDAQCQADEPVVEAWLGRCQAASVDGRVFGVHAMVLRVDADRMHARQQHEDQLADAYARQLNRWRDGPHELVLVRVMFIAERQLPRILQGSAARHWQREDKPAS